MISLTRLAESTNARSSDEELIHLCQRFRDEAEDDVLAVAALAKVLAQSGTVTRIAEHAADIASTGGPSSLTTLICPLMLVLAGWNVPKVTVPGRPAGSIDVLETISGFRPNPSISEMRAWIQEAHLVHALAGQAWTPLDARLFVLRQQSGFQNVPPLVVASILSKKYALGLDVTGVEIRRGSFGNVGDDIATLNRTRSLFSKVADALGFRCTAVVTGDGFPYQPYIGRGESLIALKMIFDGSSNQYLDNHLNLCEMLVRTILPNCGSVTDRESLRRVFAANLSVQGSTYRAFEDRLAALAQYDRSTLRAGSAGILSWNLNEMRSLIGASQQDEHETDLVGIELLTLGGLVTVGQSIAYVRGLSASVDVLNAIFTVAESDMTR